MLMTALAANPAAMALCTSRSTAWACGYPSFANDWIIA